MIWTCMERKAHFMHASNALNASPQAQASGRAGSAEAEFRIWTCKEPSTRCQLQAMLCTSAPASAG